MGVNLRDLLLNVLVWEMVLWKSEHVCAHTRMWATIARIVRKKVRPLQVDAFLLERHVEIC